MVSRNESPNRRKIMAYRKDVTDKQWVDVETANDKGGIPVDMNSVQRVIGKAVDTTPYRTAHAAASQVSNAGVVMPWSDRPDKFFENFQGRRT